MKELLYSAKYLAEDMASMILFLIIITVTHNVAWAVAGGMILGVGQIVWYVSTKRKMAAMTLLSVALVLAAGTATLLTHDPRFVMIKPSVISIIVGIFMCKPGWMTRYLPLQAQELVPDVAVVFGFIWAGLMFFSAGLNIYLALTMDTVTWAKTMAIFSPVSMGALFLIQFATMRTIAIRPVARGATLSEAAMG